MNNYNNNNRQNFNNDNRNKNLNNLNVQLNKLHINKGDILLVRCLDDSVPNSKYMNLLKYLKQNENVGQVILAPKEIKIETIQEDDLQHIIDRLIEIRDNKWKNKLQKGE